MPEPTVVEDSSASVLVEPVDVQTEKNHSSPPEPSPAEADSAAPTGELQGELAKALDDLRQIDDNIRSLTGRNPIEVLNFRAGRGRDVPVPRIALKTELRLDEVKKKFTAIEPPEPTLRGGFRRRVFEPVDPSAAVRDFRSRFIPRKCIFQPAISSSVAPAPKDPESRVKAIAELKTKEKKEIRQRNRRMFQNVLLGTLKQFQRDEQKFERQEKRQLEVQKKLDENERRRKLEEEEATRDLIGKRRQQQAAIRRVQRKLHLVESAKDWEEHMKKLQNFIQTAAKPPIFYLPAKHTVRTIELQRKSVKKLDDIIAQRRERLETDLKDFDANRFTDRRRSPPRDGERRRPRRDSAPGADGAGPSHHHAGDTKRMRMMRGDEDSEEEESSGGEEEGHHHEKTQKTVKDEQGVNSEKEEKPAVAEAEATAESTNNEQKPDDEEPESSQPADASVEVEPTTGAEQEPQVMETEDIPVNETAEASKIDGGLNGEKASEKDSGSDGETEKGSPDKKQGDGDAENRATEEKQGNDQGMGSDTGSSDED